MPVVMKLSGVLGIAALTSRIRSHGSSRWKRTDTAMWVLEVKSSAWKPTRSSVGAIAGRPASSAQSRSRGSGCRRASSCRRCSIVRITRRPPDTEERRAVLDERGVLGADLRDRARDAGGDRVHHLHHLDQADDVSASTREPTSTNGAAPGAGAR